MTTADLETELEICRDAIERAVEFVKACIDEDDRDETQGAGRATLRRLNEAVGKACPKLLYEKQEGRLFYGLRYRELKEENEKLKHELADEKEIIRKTIANLGKFEERLKARFDQFVDEELGEVFNCAEDYRQ